MESKQTSVVSAPHSIREGLVVSLFLLLLCLCACHRDGVTISPEEQARKDSLALHVAVMPVTDCLPLYYAERMGVFEKEKLDVRLHEYLSTADCDTALTNKVCQVAYTDLFRLKMMNLCDTTHVLATLDGKLYLISARGKRIRSTKHLKERMVTLNRHSTADYWSDQILEEAGLEAMDIYRPQINDIRLRTTMLCDELVDAAILPEPYASWAELKGHRRIAQTGEFTLPTACFAIDSEVSNDTHRKKQMAALIRVFRAAEGAMKKELCTDSLRSILLNKFTLPNEVVDSLIQHQADSPTLVVPNIGTAKSQDIEIVEKWWTKRHSYN